MNILTLSLPLAAVCAVLDNTFKIAAKATVVSKDGTHTKLLKGGILSVINEASEIISWVSPTVRKGAQAN